MEFIQAHLADSMATTQTDGLSNCFIKSLSANWAGEEIRPLWSLYRHCFWSYNSLTHLRRHTHTNTQNSEKKPKRKSQRHPEQIETSYTKNKGRIFIDG